MLLLRFSGWGILCRWSGSGCICRPRGVRRCCSERVVCGTATGVVVFIIGEGGRSDEVVNVEDNVLRLVRNEILQRRE
jgi:hypothetical protein